MLWLHDFVTWIHARYNLKPIYNGVSMSLLRKLIGVWLIAILVIGPLTPQAVLGLTVAE